MLRPVSVHLLPALFEPDVLRGSVAVVIDVLRATTTIVHALAAGALAVIPCGEVEEARRIASEMPQGTALLGGERGGEPISGFDLGNSPSSYTPERLRGKTLVFTTTNGTRALLHSRMADRIMVASFANLHAVVQALVLAGKPVHIVCAGTDGGITAEDCLCAGAIAAAYARALHAESVRADFAGDETTLALGAFETLGRKQATFLKALRASRGGANLIELGMGADIDTAAEWDQFEIVPELFRDPWRIVPAGDGSSRLSPRWLDAPS